MRNELFPLIILSLFVGPRLNFAQNTFESAGPTSLLELYTSEGCSSCPPAEKWLSNLQSSDKLWKQVVPVAFHVDYWNSLGWKDRFSRAEFTTRQRQYAAEWGSGSIYTPGFVLDGQEWQGWYRGAELVNPGGKVAPKLKVKFSSGAATVSFSPAGDEGAYVCYVAPLAMNQSSNVSAGENSGRHLEHRFVALGLYQQALKNQSGSYEANVSLPGNSADALAVWVCRANSLKPVQATGGYLGHQQANR